MKLSSSSSSSFPLRFFSAFFHFIFSLAAAQATVPPSETFKFVNQGEFGYYITEYDANYRVLDVQTFPFYLCFYNTTPNAFTLGLRLGHRRSESIFRWVWDANRGKPVGENATLTFGPDGNLVLADANGQVAWQTGTTNKGVVGLKLLKNGNLVLNDEQGKFVWQSFDHPSDTLLVGQALRPRGPNKLVSRVSDVDGSEGPFSFVMGKKRWAMYFKSKNMPKPLPYYAEGFGDLKGSLGYVFNSAPVTDEAYVYELRFEFDMGNSTIEWTSFLARPKFNSTFSALRVGSDGNLKIYTYYDKVDYEAWEVTYILFDRDWYMSECRLPRRCGSLGVCEDNQCVACPRPQGLFGWSKNCVPPVLPPCKAGASVDYYEVVGVEHFMNTYTEGDGPMKLVECRKKCDKDCGCLGFFYREVSSKCLLAPELGTLRKVSNTSHVAFVKISK